MLALHVPGGGGNANDLIQVQGASVTFVMMKLSRGNLRGIRTLACNECEF